MVPEVRVAPPPRLVHEIVTGTEVTHAAHVGVGHVALDDGLGIVLLQVDLGHDAVRVTQPVGEGLEPPGLLDGVLDAQRGLDMDGLPDIGEAGLGDVLVGPVALRLDALDVTQDGVLPAWLEPAVVQVGSCRSEKWTWVSTNGISAICRLR